LEDLRVRDLLDNTIIVLVSDHGEALGEHGLFAHKYGLYDELVRVPLLIRYPEKVEPKRYSHAVSTRDLYGTLMDLADLRRPKSLKESPSLLSKEGPTAVYSEIASTNSFKYEELLERFPQVESNVQPFLQTARMVESNGFKLIAYEDGRRELYNIKRDPGEMADLSSTDKAQVDHLKGVLLNWFQGLEPWERRGSGLPEEVVDPTGDEAKLLQLLGYVE
jgi:arylsulfatase A-like enzyme